MGEQGFTEDLMHELLDDVTKYISDDVTWREASAWFEFEVRIHDALNSGLKLFGRVSKILPRLHFTVTHPEAGRIYALCVGQDHRNPDGTQVGELHKHIYTDEHGQGWAYVPEDISATLPNVESLWRDFCEEAQIRHDGRFLEPPYRQEELWH